MTAKITKIYEHTYRDVGKCLQTLADEIAAGDHGKITSAAYVLITEEDEVLVFGSGDRSAVGDIIYMLNRGIWTMCARDE